ncbi:hypothetical protein PSTT_06032 [Puccinia striiformis]|uniref:Integrase catalytic domain-containing protein n=1 Tax=Puccinia striiformis TaxID=27350 RepID=A0A2S4VLP9_9BASI|nr:hypothetical protein PSTT_06032 [Puccinia striiformis]
MTHWIKPHPGFGIKEVYSANLGEESKQVGIWKYLQIYLETLNKPPGCSEIDYKKIKHKSAMFFMSEDQLKRRSKPFPQVVISSPDLQKSVLNALHEELGHRGIDETYRRIKLRFWWPNMKRTVKNWVQSCVACQKRSSAKPMELKKASGKSTIFGRVSLDTIHIKAGKWKYLVVARDDLSGWVEAVGMDQIKAKKIASWFMEHWVFRYGVPLTVVVDGGPEFGQEVQGCLKEVGANVKVTTPYYPEANGMIERGHQPLKDTLVKLCENDGKKWKHYFPLVLFADRISIKRTTGYSPYELVFGQSSTLPVDLELETYLGTNWDDITSTEDLLAARTLQLDSIGEPDRRRRSMVAVARMERTSSGSFASKYASLSPADPTLGSLLPLSLPNLYAQARILACEGPATRPFHPCYRHHALLSPIGFSNRPGHEYPIRPFGRTQREDSAYATSTEAHELVAAQVVQEETVLQGRRFMKEAFDIYFRVCGSIPSNTNVDTRDLREMIAKRLYSDIMGHMDSVLGDVDSVELMFVD